MQTNVKREVIPVPVEPLRLLDPDERLQPGHLALHRQLVLVLRDQLARGAVEVGQLLPGELALAQQYGVSRITVRRALADLAGEGLIERRQGRGTFALQRPASTPYIPVGMTDREVLRKATMETTVAVLTVELQTAPAAVAQLFGAPRALHVLRVRSGPDLPLMLTDAWVPEHLSDNVTREALARHPLYELLEDAGATLHRVTQVLSAQVADPQGAKLLRVPIGAPLLSITRVLHDPDLNPVAQVNLLASPQRSRVVMDIAFDQLDTTATGFLAHDVHT